jgi:hypothetical protein
MHACTVNWFRQCGRGLTFAVPAAGSASAGFAAPPEPACGRRASTAKAEAARKVRSQWYQDWPTSDRIAAVPAYFRGNFVCSGFQWGQLVTERAGSHLRGSRRTRSHAGRSGASLRSTLVFQRSGPCTRPTESRVSLSQPPEPSRRQKPLRRPSQSAEHGALIVQRCRGIASDNSVS